MDYKKFDSRIIHKHDVESNWLNAASFIPFKGELIIYDIDEIYNYERFKIGDGTTTVNELPFVGDEIRDLLNYLVGEVPVQEQIANSMEDVLYKTSQELTLDEVNQVRENIHSVGQYATGLTYYPFNPIETTDDLYFDKELLDPIEAAIGAEIYNDYENNIATGYYSIASGFGTQALGNFSHSSGWLTKAPGYCSIASGRRSEATGHYSHAEGMNTQAIGNHSHAENEGCIAKGGRAHAEGYYTEANTNQAHAEGMYCKANGINSHAEGWETIASGQNAFSGGKQTKATGTNSTARGLGTIAAGQNQFVNGKYNISDTSSLVIIGNGTSDTNRKNAYKLDNNGNGWFAVGISVGEEKASVVLETDYIIFDGGTAADVINETI